MSNIKDQIEDKIEREEEKIEPTLKEEVKKNVWGLYGLVYIFFLIVIVSIGSVYMNKIGYLTSLSKVPPTLTDTTQSPDPLEVPIKKGGISPPVDVFAFKNPSPELIAEGKEVYNTACVSCHGDNGTGDGPAGAMLDPPPRNFTNMTGWTNGPGIDMMYKTLQEGILDKGMASYSNLSPDQRLAMISYIRTFSDQYPPITDAELEELDKQYSLAQGVKEPNQIPVSLAIQKLVDEYAPTERSNNLIATGIENDDSPGAVVFRKVSKDINRSITSLSAYPGWSESALALVNFITTNPIEKGFNPVVDDLTAEEWNVLLQYLRSTFNYQQEIQEIQDEANDDKNDSTKVGNTTASNKETS